MERVAVFVDAGYFWVQLSHIVYGERRKREEISLNARLMRESLLREVKKHFPESSLLRVYWYDGLGLNELPTEQHKSICCLDDIKMRYGTRNSVGQQKGVDGLLMADLIALGQNKAISSAIIISGDADLVPGISAAQMLGVRIHRLEISGQDASSPTLCEEVDRNSEWPRNDIESFAGRINKNSLIIQEEEDQNNQPLVSLDEIADKFVSSLNDNEKDEIVAKVSIPPEKDKQLLFQAKVALKRFLRPEEKKELRYRVRQLLTK